MDDMSPPAFRGRLDDETILIQLDSSALSRLSGAAAGVDRFGVVAAQSARIRIAAQRLVEAGFHRRVTDGPTDWHLRLSAIDLD